MCTTGNRICLIWTGSDFPSFFLNKKVKGLIFCKSEGLSHFSRKIHGRISSYMQTIDFHVDLSVVIKKTKYSKTRGPSLNKLSEYNSKKYILVLSKVYCIGQYRCKPTILCRINTELVHNIEGILIFSTFSMEAGLVYYTIIEWYRYGI